MKLLVVELKEKPIYQSFRSIETTYILAVRLHLFKYGNPVGALKVEIQNDRGQIAATSETIEISAIEGEYYHGLIRFYVKCPLVKNRQYRLVLKGVGYEFSEEAYVGWCVDYNDAVYPVRYTSDATFKYGLGFEVWVT